MKILTSCFRGPEDNLSSLILQQAMRKRGRMHILFACVCMEDAPAPRQGAGAAFGLRLTDWFYESALARWSRWKEPDLEVFGEELVRMAAGGRFSTAGILCAGSRFLLFYRGAQRICLINSRFLRPNVKGLSGRTEPGEGLVTKQGLLQPGISLLIGTEPFYRGISREKLGKCLWAGALGDEGQLRRHLEELGRYGEKGYGEECCGEEGYGRKCNEEGDYGKKCCGRKCHGEISYGEEDSVHVGGKAAILVAIR